jgi:hypothetical protein
MYYVARTRDLESGVFRRIFRKPPKPDSHSVVRFHREGWGAPRRARSPVPVCTTSSRSPLDEVIRISTASGPGTRTGAEGYSGLTGLLRLRTNSA